jgi:hypothetical protein
MTPEGKIKSGCLHYLERRRFMCWSNPTGAVNLGGRWVHFGRVGSSDIIGCLPDGRFLGIETKAARGRLSPEQRDFADQVNGLGGLALVVRDWRELDAALRKAGYVDDGELFSGEGAE